MKKNYMSPKTEKVRITFAHHFLNSSPGAGLTTDEEIEEDDLASRREWFSDDED